MNITRILKTEITAKTLAVFTIASMILSAFPAAFFVANAAVTDIFTDGPATAILGAPYNSGDIDASGYSSLNLSFDYEAEGIDSGDSFTYGWSSAASTSNLGTIDGSNETVNAVPGDETGSVSVPLPVEAQVSDLEIFVTSTGDADNDIVNLTNIVVSGDVFVQETEEIDITGDTWDAVGNPTGTGWFFNPFPPYTAPFEFNDDTASIGDGAFLGGPVTAVADSKIIATLQSFTPVDGFESFSYDFDIVANDASDENEFYLNVYANFGSSDPTKFYDCRYDVVPTVGTVGSFTTVTFAADSAATAVTTHGSSPFTCPTNIEDMESLDAGAVIRAFALNIGDTAAQDAGVSGYFDNVVLETTEKITTYDFEPAPIEPNPLVSECIDPEMNLLENGSFERPEVTKKRNWDLFTTTDWTTTALDDDAEIELEFHRGWSGNMAVDGEQYAALDPTESVKITQTPDVLEGATYELSWAFAPRHNLGAEENQLSVLVDGTEVATEGPAIGDAGLEPLDWTRSSYTFTAASGSVEIAFADAGINSNSVGTFLDDARLCLVQEPDPEPPEICSYEGDVVSYTQGTKNNGNAVDANRSDVSAVEVGVASYTNFFGKEGNDWQVNPLDFYSLGINGELVFEFTDKIVVDQPGPDIAIWEITGGNADEQADESADVYVSQNGVDFELAGNVTGDGAVDISGTSFDFVKFVKLVDRSNGVQGGNGDGYDLDAITIIEGSCEDFVVVHTDKIVCEVEEDLPGWGSGGPNMTENTATDWISEEHPSCELVEGWEFEWAPKGTSDPGDVLVGPAGGDWNTFTGSTVIPFSEIDGDGFFWMREVLEEDYIPFTHGATPNNSDDYSAEMYCHTDVKNYDNFDRVDGPKEGEEYYCVAWNVPDPMCSLEAVSDTGTVVVDNENYAVETWVHPAWTAVIPGADWIWEAYKVLDSTIDTTKTFSETFTAEGIKNAFLDVAADNTYKVFINDVLVVDVIDGNNFKDFSQDSYDVTSYIQDGDNTLEIEVTNTGVGNSSPESNPAGLLYKLVVNAETECELTTFVDPYEPPKYGPYCGDGIVQGEQDGGWEMCEPGDEGCTDYCTWDNQCTDLQLVKITLDDEAPESVSFDGSLHLGAAGNIIPNGTWFNFEEAGDTAVHTIANGDIDGLAIERTDTELRLAVKGENSRNYFDYVFGSIMTKGIDLGDVDRGTVTGWELEDTGSYVDEFDVDKDEDTVDFKMWLTTGDDAVAVGVAQGEEYDCPECKAGVEARIVLNDTGYAGAGSEIENIVLGDAGYTTVAFGEWFPISEAANPGESAVMITDPNTVTNFANAADKDGLFVSREAGTVKVALYGEFANAKIDNEWIDARIEIRDAKITNFMELQGAFKFENHPENDSVDSNDGFDDATVDDTGVDFKMWVDTGSDGFKFNIDQETIAFCEDDSVDTYPVKGDKYEVAEGYQTVGGWTIYATNGDVTLSTTTDNSGRYHFDLPAGEWTVYEGSQIGWEQESVYQDGIELEASQCSFVFGVDGKSDSPITSSGGYNYCDFYNQQVSEELNYIDGYKYDATSSTSDPVLYAGWPIYITNGLATTSTTTDEGGYYYFEVPAGEWTVYEGMLEGWEQVEVQQSDFIQITDGEPIVCDFTFYGEEIFQFARVSDIESDQDEYFGNRCSFTNRLIEDVPPTVTPDDEPTRSSRSSGARTNNTPEGVVAGASTSFCPFIEDYMQIGIDNDAWEVTKLQMFLSLVMGYATPVTGVFDATTDAHVKLFQERYRDEILTPWFEQGIVPHSDPTGFVYKLTRWKINDIVCPGWEEYPSFEGEDLTINIELD